MLAGTVSIDWGSVLPIHAIFYFQINYGKNSIHVFINIYIAEP